MIKDKKLLINIMLLVLLLSFVGIMAIRENKLKNTESVVVEDFSTEENLEKSENGQTNRIALLLWFQTKEQTKKKLTNMRLWMLPDYGMRKRNQN